MKPSSDLELAPLKWLEGGLASDGGGGERRQRGSTCLQVSNLSRRPEDATQIYMRLVS